MAQYKTGTVDLTNGDATVTGSGTAFLSEVEVGDSFIRVDEGVVYDVASVTSDTALELSTPYSGATASGVNFVIARDFTPNQNYPELERGSLETASLFTRAMRDIDEDIAARALTGDLGTAAYDDTMSSLTDTTADRLMPVGAFGLGVQDGIDVSDADAAFRNAFYNITGATNVPEGSAGTILAAVRNLNSGFHVYNPGTGLNRYFIRDRSAGVFSPWVKLVHTGNILGTVSQSSGVPTGAVIERGSNANGSYTIWADGYCVSMFNVGSTASGAAYRANLPITYIGSYKPILTCSSDFARYAVAFNLTGGYFDCQTYSDSGVKSSTAAFAVVHGYVF